MGDKSQPVKIDNYTGLRLESYLNNNGERVYGIVLLSAGQNETWYNVYVQPTRWSKEDRKGVPDMSKKPRPSSFRLGVGKAEALENLGKIKEMLEVM